MVLSQISCCGKIEGIEMVEGMDLERRKQNQPGMTIVWLHNVNSHMRTVWGCYLKILSRTKAQ